MSGMRQWVDTHAVSFGDVSFMVTGTAQWESESLTVTKRIPGGNSSVTQFLGRGPETVTYDLVFASLDEFHTFKQRQGSTGTLTLTADTAALADRGPAVIAGIRYDRLTDVTLLQIEPGSTQFGRNGIVRCQATFQRAPSETVTAPIWIGAAS